MWSGRFREPLDPQFEHWQRSFPFDWRLIGAELRASGAHAAMLQDAGVLTAAEADTMQAALLAIGEQNLNTQAEVFSPDAPFASSAAQAEDVHHFVELELVRHIGDLALKLHTGRSRNEQIATDMRLYILESIDRIASLIRAWCGALIDLAEDAGAAAMPAYTHLQRAEPVLVAHWLLAYVSMAERDLSRLRDCRRRMDLCPLGSGAVAGATLPLDRSIAAERLRFSGPTLNSMDATSDRDFALEFTQAVAVFALHLSRFAEELTLYASSEFGFLDLSERFSTGSSAMPQKKNPDFTELLRGKAGRIVGSAVALLTLMKGLPLAYNKDLQEGQEPVFEASATITDVLRVLVPFTASLRFCFDHMRLCAESGYLNAMAAATYLSNKGIPFRTAHECVGGAVRLGIETGRELHQLSLPELQKFNPAFASDLYEALTLQATIDCHDVIGGTATHRVSSALRAAKGRLQAWSLEGEPEVAHAVR